MEEPVDKVALAARYEAVKARLPEHVQLVAVSKTRSVAEIQALYDLGQRAFGENYPQELRDKQPKLPADIQWHFIGHLQTNKVKYIAPFTFLIHGVDSIALLDEMNKRAAANDRILRFLLQVHIAQEETKHGFSPEEVAALTNTPMTIRWPNLRLCGLMGMATNTEDRATVGREFRKLAALFHRVLHSPGVLPIHFTVLSMGMSGDADIAVEEGSTLVRIGTAIFGERPARN